MKLREEGGRWAEAGAEEPEREIEEDCALECWREEATSREERKDSERDEGVGSEEKGTEEE